MPQHSHEAAVRRPRRLAQFAAQVAKLARFAPGEWQQKEPLFVIAGFEAIGLEEEPRAVGRPARSVVVGCVCGQLPRRLPGFANPDCARPMLSLLANGSGNKDHPRSVRGNSRVGGHDAIGKLLRGDDIRCAGCCHRRRLDMIGRQRFGDQDFLHIGVPEWPAALLCSHDRAVSRTHHRMLWATISVRKGTGTFWMARSESTQFLADTPRTLSDDIYLLAGLLGDVLRGSAGERAFAQTELARGLAKELRGGDLQAGDQLDALARELPDNEAETLVRAFTNYFQLINLAEDSERIRRIRHREAATGGPRRGSIDEAIGLLAARGVDAQQFAALLDSAQVRLVLTAHPTEARRRTILAKLSRIFGVLRDLDERAMLPDESARARQLLAHTIAEVWYSEDVRATKLTVLDEVRTSLVYLLSTFVDVVPAIYRDLEDAIARHYPDAGIRVPP